MIRYEALLRQTEGMITETYSYITDYISSQEESSNSTVVFNSLPWERQEWLHLHGRWHKVQIPSMGYTVVSDHEDQEVMGEIATGIETDVTALETDFRDSAKEYRMENDILILKFDPNGGITSILDKLETREIILQGQRGTIFVYIMTKAMPGISDMIIQRKWGYHSF